MTLQDYISEAISTGKHRKKYTDNILRIVGTSRIPGTSRLRDIIERLSSSSYYFYGLYNDAEKVFKNLDTEKPKGIDTENMMRTWFHTDKSNVTGDPRIFIFPDMASYIVLDFDGDNNLIGIDRLNAKNPEGPRNFRHDTGYLLNLMSRELFGSIY